MARPISTTPTNGALIQFRIKPEERELLSALANAQGMTVSELLRAQVRLLLYTSREKVA